MKTKFTLAFTALALLCVAVTVYSQVQKGVPASQGWEYTEVELPQAESSLQKLNALGAQGWELVSVISACRDHTKEVTVKIERCEYWAYLKRRK